MLRALSTRRSYHGYDRLGEASGDAADAQLKRATSVPPGSFDFVSAAKPELVGLPSAKSQAKIAKKASKIHPLFHLFSGKSRKQKATASPEFSRYLEYVKEGGLWQKDADSPAMRY